MRKALFALAMIGAAFAGGAVVNGTGLAWLQSALKAAGRKGEFVRVLASNDAPPPPQSDASAEPRPPAPVGETMGGSSNPREIPAAPLPPLVVHRPEGPKEISEPPKPPRASDASSPQSKSSAESTKSPAADPDAPKPPEPLLASAVGLDAVPDPVSEAPPLDNPASTKPVEPPRPPRVDKLPDPGEAPGPDGAVARAQKLSDPVAAPDAVPPLTPPAGAATPVPALAAAAAGPREWAEVRKKLRDLGVSRFEIDGELAGKVRFRCVIPLAGRRAVGQMFEGEGDDEFQAADAAIKRIHLWKVSEAPGS